MFVPFLLALTGDPKPVAPVADELPPGFGHAVELCGDLDGDGCSEFAIGGHGGFNLPAGIVIYGGRYGGVFRRITTSVENEFVRGPICRAGDLDGDHVDDLAVSIGSASGRVEIRSGKSGAVVRTLSPIEGEVDFGIGLCRLRDVDADGVDDLVVTTGLEGQDHHVRWIVVSGAAGRRLRAFEWKGPDACGPHLARSNASAVAIGDVNADGIEDFAVVDERVVRLESGAESKTLRSLPISQQKGKNSYRVSLLGIPDADGDGHPDIIVGTPCAEPMGLATYLTVYSSASGAVIRTIARSMDQRGYGFALCLAPTKSADGSTEVWLTRHDWFGSYLMRASLTTGEDGAAVRSYRGCDDYGYTLATGADVNGDGITDVIVGEYSPFDGGLPTCGGYVYSGKDGKVLWERLRDPVKAADR